ncbi:hypothetical protein BO70DRAFT_350390 [Aspergillus heteromorphus CBS 117.55]|uniref:CFEM domain-containing protein n=1 Tax=Aspergillus heteromorphus CBS 117.55 TaxID=1448321 RepID=A0A317WWG3_9EURO|nr:uncharacterized protein BO70DRAFT_350390 [Aspergillus heteromorphus CBS 117.55]PWY89158.1 hypothetical protein BO70DRAFT_350390 [Aspergillus heteromorphus CBS 117.55]
MNSTMSEALSSDLPACAWSCVAQALSASACTAMDTSCFCKNATVVDSAIGCYSLSCLPKQILYSTNTTRSACGIPEANQKDLTPALAGALGMLAVLMVALRMGQRIFMKKSFGWDDGLILMALACALPLNIMAFPMQKYGLGTNIWTIPFPHITKQLKLLLIAEVCYMPAEALTQLSFLAFYLRIFPLTNFRYVVYTMAAISICFGVSNTLVMIFQCTPVSYFWTSWTGETSGTCIKISDFSWYRAAMQIAMDLSIIALPIWPLSKLCLSLRKKSFVLLIITVVSCLRLQSLVRFSKSTNISMEDNPAIYWSMVECDVAIVCACMPCLPSLLRPIFPTCFGTHHYASDIEPTPPPPMRLDRIKKINEFSVLSTTISEDALMQNRM